MNIVTRYTSLIFTHTTLIAQTSKTSKMICCFRKKSLQKDGRLGAVKNETEIEDVSSEGSTFGIVENVTTKFNISRCGPENEIHTKVIDILSPFKDVNSSFKADVQIDDELDPSRYLHVAFEDIHDSHYIGLNSSITFKDKGGGEIPYENIEVDGKQVDHDQVKPAFPTIGWWAVVGGAHSLLFDFGERTHVKEISILCINSASTPKIMKVTDSTGPRVNVGAKYDADFIFQLAGETEQDPTEVEFADQMTCEQVVESLNANNPENFFKSFLSKDGQSQFVFYEKGKRTSAYNYYFGAESTAAIRHINSVKPHNEEVEDVALRALSLEELRGIRAIIMSNCVKEDWRSSYDEHKLLPEEVNLYDLNQNLILPLTKQRNCSFKELFTTGEAKPTYYVSHWWGESVLDFIRCCEYHAERHGLSPDAATYWVCELMLSFS